MEVKKSDKNTNKKEIKKKKSSVFDKVTHIYLQDKHLVIIPQFSNAQDVQTLYLYNNHLTKIENLNGFYNLYNLYLQNNRIDKIENLQNLKKLKKLYLGKNKIQVLEGLECIEDLEELYIEKQELVDNTPLCLDPRTITRLSTSLRILNISNNKMVSLAFLAPLKCLESLDASYNDLDDIKDVCQAMRNFFYLKDAKLLGNPVSKKHHYRENIIASTFHLEILDNKNISDLSRTFIKRFEESKLIYGTKPSVNLADIVPGLPKNFPTSLQKAATASIIKESRFKLIDDLSAFETAEPVHISWNLLPQRKPLTKPESQSILRGHKMESHRNIVVSKSCIRQRSDS